MPNSSSPDPGTQPRVPESSRPGGRGLLEQFFILVRPQSSGGRLLVDEQGVGLGFARWSKHGWFGSVLAVYEQEQSPLVCTIRRRFSLWPRHEVRDAEGELVGVLAGNNVHNRWDRAVMRYQPHRGGGGYLDLAGKVLATWSDERLELHPPVWHDPFAKMLLLAAVLLRS